MTASGLEFYQAALDELAGLNRVRALAPRTGMDFSSNDYLGLAGSKRLGDAVAAAIARGTPVGAGGSRLLRGNAPEHEALETRAARFFGAERALYFGSGYVANYALLSTLPQRGDLLVLDGLVHASVHEGARAGRAEFTKVVHNDPAAFEDAVRTYRARGGRGRVWLAVESLYSMDGDRACLTDLAEIADRHEAMLLIDEAHATGLYGTDGRGLAAPLEGRDNIITLHTCGKALGAAGALVSGPRVLCEFLINRCRPFIYSTAPSPLMAVAALEALDILVDEPDRRQRFAQLVAAANRAARSMGGATPTGSQILPAIVGEEGHALALAAALQRRGFDVRAIRPPTVPDGTARLRISITLNVDERTINALFAALAEERQGLAA